MPATTWFLIIGALLIVMAVSGSLVRRLPLTAAMLYLTVGVAVGPTALGLLRLDPLADAELVERLTEVAVLISLFTAGLKLRNPWQDRRWQLPLRLASLSMVATVALIAVVGVVLLDLPVGAGVLLGAVLAPTDPVLASDVQVESAEDSDRLRFALTGEAGLNDGTAFPFVMLGLGLLGLHDMGAGGWRWATVDVAWACVAGVGVGWMLGTLVGRLVLWLRQTRHEAVGYDDLLALGLIALAYGIALLCSAYGFLAVFAAGLGLRRVERIATSQSGMPQPAPEVRAAARGAAGLAIDADPHDIATRAETAPAYMAEAALGFTEQLERVAELAVVVVIGSMLTSVSFTADALWFVPLLLCVIRPLAVQIGAPMRGAPRRQRLLTAWFGIRGIGALYYLSFAIAHGLPRSLAEPVLALSLATVATSIVVHGVSVTPLMGWYTRRAGRAR